MADEDYTLRLCACGCGEFAARPTRKNRIWRYKRGHGTGVRPRPAIDRVLPRLIKTTTCWLWPGSRNKGGYGTVSAGGKCLKVPRVVWEAAHGPIPDGYEVCHHCDNPPCGRLSHLFLGTRLDNVRDMISKGRMRTHSMRGADHPMARLTHSDVDFIRAQYVRGKPGLNSQANAKLLAAQFGVTASHIRDIARGRCWKKDGPHAD